MASLPVEFGVIPQLRPCLVGAATEQEGAQKALFHCWSNHAYIVHPSPLVGGHGGGQVWNTYALVELESGEIVEVPACNVRFLDPPHKRYCFELQGI